jgi:hypothetical protein
MDLTLFALVSAPIVAIAGWRLANRPRPTPGANGAAASVRRELSRLDPFSFFVISGHPYGVDQVVVGTTGSFAISVGREPVDGNFRRDVARARRGAKRLRQGAGPAAVHSRFQALVCLPGRQFVAKSSRGARVIPWGDVVTEIVSRSRSVTPHQAQRIADALGALPRQTGLAG